MPEGRGPADDKPALAALLAKKTADGTPLYSSPITGLVNTAESAILIRNLLLAQHDGNAAIVLAGPATGVVRILGLYVPGRRSRRSASSWSSPPVRSRPGAPEATIKSDVAAARKLFAEWPTPIVAVGSEVGDALPYPGASIEKDFAWAPAHPVVDAYRALKPMPYDAPASALAAVLYAVHPDDGLFQAVGPGHDHRARRRPDAVHAGGGRQASLSDRRSRAERARHSPCIAPWCPPRRRHGPAAAGGQQ